MIWTNFGPVLSPDGGLLEQRRVECAVTWSARAIKLGTLLRNLAAKMLKIHKMMIHPWFDRPARAAAMFLRFGYSLARKVGNGSLDDQGDVLFRDHDHDGFGNLIMEAGVTNLPLSLYYKPLGPSEEVVIDLETRDGDRWQFDSQDVVRRLRN